MCGGWICRGGCVEGGCVEGGCVEAAQQTTPERPLSYQRRWGLYCVKVRRCRRCENVEV